MSRSQAEEMEGVEMTSRERQSPPLLNEDELRILEVYDRLEELQLEIALLKSQIVLSQGELSLFVKQMTLLEAYKLQMSPWEFLRKISQLPGKSF